MGCTCMACGYFRVAFLMILVADGVVIDVNQQYGEILGECGGAFWQRSGRFSSPGFPQGYPPNSFCFWEIRAPADYVIELEFPHFDLEWSNDACWKDKVLVLDSDHKELASLCGDNQQPRFLSIGNGLTIGLLTNAGVDGKGFMANYSMVRDPSAPVTAGVPVTLPRSVLMHYDDCGGTITDHAAIIESPQYPTTYPHNTLCVWNINPPHGSHIYLTFESLDLEEDDPRCERDYVDVMDSKAEVIGRFCGHHIPEVVITSESKMVVILKTDGGKSGTGFLLSYTNKKPTDKSIVFLGVPERDIPLHEDL